jgi:hypothetical protein
MDRKYAAEKLRANGRSVYAFKNYVLKLGWGGMSELAAKIGKSVSYIDKRISLGICLLIYLTLFGSVNLNYFLLRNR